jgi:hypothetical protein
MVDHGQRAAGLRHSQLHLLQHLERALVGAVMHEMPVHIQHRRVTWLLGHQI